jgi:hypothetical protein
MIIQFFKTRRMSGVGGLAIRSLPNMRVIDEFLDAHGGQAFLLSI